MSRFVRREEKRAWLYARTFDGRVCRCVYCGRKLWLHCSLAVRSNGRAATLDHVVPGAGHGADNLVPACHDCNSRKGVRPLSPANYRRAVKVLLSVPSPEGLKYARRLMGCETREGAWSAPSRVGRWSETRTPTPLRAAWLAGVDVLPSWGPLPRRARGGAGGRPAGRSPRGGVA